MYYSTIDEYTAEIALVQASIRRTLESQRYGSSTSGVSRESQRAALPELKSYLKELISERDQMVEWDSTPVTRIFAKCGRR